MKKFFFFFLVLSFSGFCQSEITLEEIWKSGKFRMQGFDVWKWRKNSNTYTQLIDNQIVELDIKTQQQKSILYNGDLSVQEYEWSSDEQKLMLLTDIEPIYRHSSTCNVHILDLKTKKISTLPSKKVMYPTFSPNGKFIAYVKNNNLYTFNLYTLQEKQLTKNGEKNKIINGASDWVYEEEFELTRAFEWSPNSQFLAFLSFNEKEVPEYSMQIWGNNLYPKDYLFKYPKAGEKNAVVSVHVFNTATEKIVDKTPTSKDEYTPRINWTKNNELVIRKLNRLQNSLQIYHFNEKEELIYTDKDEAYIDFENQKFIEYLQNSFLFLSEKTGFRHLYHYDFKQKKLSPLTSGNWEIDKIIGLDDTRNLIYFTSTEVSPLERHVYQLNIKTLEKNKISTQKGTNEAHLSPDGTHLILENSSVSTPLDVRLFELVEGKFVFKKILQDNKILSEKLSQTTWKPKDFFSLTIDNQNFNGWKILPPNFDSTKKYPLILFVYGGPGSQTVKDSWDRYDQFWYQILAQKGFIVMSIDNRGTGGRGAAFKKIIYKQLGKIETQDQTAFAVELGKLPYIDRSRIGIWGWSYGGFMAANCIFQSNTVFKAAISVAPVTNWRFYDSIYTERYLQTPQENPLGYDENSPISHAQKLSGKYLLIHGTGDDNVHFQNTVALQNKLIEHNKQFQSFYYPDRNHGIYGGITRYHLYQLMTEFWEKNL